VQQSDRFSVSRANGVAVVAVAGEFDLGSVPDFRRARDQALKEHSPLVVDLTRCQFIDSTGIGALITCFKRAAQEDVDYALVGSGPQVGRVLELVGIPGRVPTFTSLDEARRALGKEPR
jgi:anti-sigma B factor antagonist